MGTQSNSVNFEVPRLVRDVETEIGPRGLSFRTVPRAASRRTDSRRASEGESKAVSAASSIDDERKDDDGVPNVPLSIPHSASLEATPVIRIPRERSTIAAGPVPQVGLLQRMMRAGVVRLEKWVDPIMFPNSKADMDAALLREVSLFYILWDVLGRVLVSHSTVRCAVKC